MRLLVSLYVDLHGVSISGSILSYLNLHGYAKTSLLTPGKWPDPWKVAGPLESGWHLVSSTWSAPKAGTWSAPKSGHRKVAGTWPRLAPGQGTWPRHLAKHLVVKAPGQTGTTPWSTDEKDVDIVDGVGVNGDGKAAKLVQRGEEDSSHDTVDKDP